MSEERISEAGERRLLGAVRGAIAQTNAGVAPDDALAKAAADENYGPDFVSRMVELFNTSRTLAHLKQASGPARAGDFPIANAEAILGQMFPVKSQGGDIQGGEMGKTADFMKIPLDPPPAFEKAAAYVHDGRAKFAKVLNSVRDLEQDVLNLRTKRAEVEMVRDGALGKAVEYFRKSGSDSFEGVDARMQSMHGQAGKLAMDVVWGSIGKLRGEKRAAAPAGPLLAEMSSEPYCYLDQFISSSRLLARHNQRVDMKTAEYNELKTALRDRSGKGAKEVVAGLASSATVGILGRALEGFPATSASGEPGSAAVSSAVESATDPAHENAIRGIKTEAMLQELMSTDPVINQYDPADVVEAYNELSRLSPMSSSQPAVIRGYLRRFLESSPDVQGRVLEGHEAQQLSDIEKTLRTGRESVKDVLKATAV